MTDPGATVLASHPSDQPARSGETRLERFLPYQLSIASNAVSSLIAERYRARFGLKVMEWRIMAVLGDTGPCTQRDLAQITLMDKVAVNRACKVLERRGLIERAANEKDGRSHLLELSQEGRAIHDAIMPLARAIEADLFDGFAEAEQAQLRAMLDRMRRRARDLLEG